MAKKGPVCLFEVSWEVCNKVGGIYTVIKSKQRFMNEVHKGNYILIGPYVPKNAALDFEEEVPQDEFKNVFAQLKRRGVICYYGQFGESKAILIDFSGLMKELDKIKADMWNDYKIDSLNSPSDFDEPLVWSVAAGMLIEKLRALKENSCVVHCHEWLAGGTLLYLKKFNVDVGTVFTTHATVLGRSCTSSGCDLYEALKSMDVDKKAYELKVHHKHQLEKASAQNADVFTTVSEITSMEAEKILGRKADVVLPNGLDMENFPTFEETSVKHGKSKKALKEFTMYYFFPYYNDIDLGNTMFFFTAGRYEVRNKGYDVLIRALGYLNKRFKAEKFEKTIVMFLWIPAKIKGLKTALLENKTFFKDINDFVEDNMWLIRENVISSIIKKTDLKKMDYPKEFIMEAKRKALAFSKTGRPSLLTHDIDNENNDEILMLLRRNGLLNRKEDRVKVVFYPAYLNGNDGLLDMEYYDALIGCHLGIFPSYYEPWGYTPLETAALGVPALTTDLSGFGRTLKVCRGLCALSRSKVDDTRFVEKLSNYMYKFAKLTKKNRVKNKLEAKRLAEGADWRKLLVHYTDAHKLALEKRR